MVAIIGLGAIPPWPPFADFWEEGLLNLIILFFVKEKLMSKLFNPV